MMRFPGLDIPALRQLFVSPVRSEVLQHRFQIGDVVHGRIIQTMPEQGVFVLYVNGFNLIAKSRLSLFPGDRIHGKVQKNEPQIELKLVEVNGEVVHHNQKISADEVSYAYVPLPKRPFGDGSYLEIYPDREENGGENESGSASIRLIVSSAQHKNLALELLLREQALSGSIWFEDDALLAFFIERQQEIQSALLDDAIARADINLQPMNREIALFRREWGGLARLDIRA